MCPKNWARIVLSNLKQGEASLGGILGGARGERPVDEGVVLAGPGGQAALVAAGDVAKDVDGLPARLRRHQLPGQPAQRPVRVRRVQV